MLLLSGSGVLNKKIRRNKHRLTTSCTATAADSSVLQKTVTGTDATFVPSTPKMWTCAGVSFADWQFILWLFSVFMEGFPRAPSCAQLCIRYSHWYSGKLEYYYFSIVCWSFFLPSSTCAFNSFVHHVCMSPVLLCAGDCRERELVELCIHKHSLDCFFFNLLFLAFHTLTTLCEPFLGYTLGEDCLDTIDWMLPGVKQWIGLCLILLYKYTK